MTEPLPVTVAGCLACQQRAITHKRYSLCRPCAMAVWRRVGRGEPFSEALADRQRQMERGRRGLVSGQGKRVATALLLACLCLPLWAAERRDKVFTGALLAFGAAVFADAWTSERAFDAGHEIGRAHV